MKNWLPSCCRFPVQPARTSPPGKMWSALMLLFVMLVSYHATAQAQRCSFICGVKFEDKNCNGVQDPGEPGIPNWQINLTDGMSLQSTLTDASGKYCFRVCVFPRTYTVFESQVDCWKQTLPMPSGTYTVDVPAGGLTLSGYDFGNSNTGTLCIYKFNDVNCNGIWDPNEVGLPWKFTITGSDGTAIRVATDDNGQVCIPLKCDTYTVCEDPRDGWVPTIADCQTIDITPCNDSKLVFGNSNTGTLCIYKFNDVNCNGIWDPGEVGLPGWKFIIQETGESVVTDDNGQVCVPEKAGTYTVCEALLAGWQPTTPVCQTTTVAPCTASKLIFGNSNTGTVCIYKFNDLNCNGIWDPNESGIPGWNFKIVETGQTVTTGAGGVICVPLIAGTYTICEGGVVGWVPTTPTCQSVTIQACDAARVVFGNSSTGTLCITKFNDVNCNGVQDPGEVGIPGWKFTIGAKSVVTGPGGTVCVSLTGGTYTVCEVTQAGWQPTTPICQTVTVAPCQTAGLSFGNSTTGTLCITKFNDINCNGIQEPGEPGIAGWKFTIGTGAAAISVITGTGGRVCVPIGSGTYTVCEQLVAGWQPTTPVCQSVTISPCQTSALSFGNSTTGTLCIVKFNDRNCNGVQDPGEPGIAGWKFTIGTGAGAISVATGPGGRVCIPIGSGTYTVCEQLVAGWQPTTPVCQNVTISPCQTSLLSFGNSTTGTLCLIKFNDLNCNGVQDPGELGIPGWQFTLNGVALGTVTDANGKLCVSVTSGNYTLCEVLQAGWVPTTPACRDITISPCQTTGLSFGNSSTGTLCIIKFNDLNCNGVQDPGEPGIPGWKFTIGSITVSTGPGGRICVPLTGGTYTVCEEIIPGWQPTTHPCQTVTISPCQTSLLSFGNSSTGTLCIIKFNDVNCNGVQDPGELGIPGWKFTLNGVSLSVVTDANGKLCVPVTGGNYVLCEVMQAGWTPTTPVCRDITISPCQTNFQSFGNSSTGTLCIVKFNDLNCNGVQDPGEPGIPGWKFTIGSSSVGMSVVTGPGGKVCVSLTGGVYTVCEVTQAGWTPTTPICQVVTVSPCQTSALSYGNSSTGTLCIVKFNDINCNGVQDPGEPGIPGWKFTLNGVSIGVLTDANGRLCVPVTGGNYVLCEVMQAGWAATTPVCRDITISPCQTNSQAFGNSTTGTVCITKFNDRNCNGVQDPGEPGIPGWKFTIGGTSFLTGTGGRVCIPLVAGTYTVCEVTQPGWQPTTPVCQTVTISPCQTSVLSFGNSTTGTLCITKFNDLNCNGVQDPGEPGIPGWKFSVAGMTVVTGTGGRVCISITSGTYTVCEGLQVGWTPTTPVCQNVTVSPCQTSALSFGNSSTGTLCIYKFNDVNCNGIWDPDEVGIPDWKFTILETGQSVATDNNGQVCVRLPAGNYTICEEIRPGWQPTTPACQTATVTPCGGTKLIFGNSNTGTVCIYKFNDENGNGKWDAGEQGIPDWKFVIDDSVVVVTGPDGSVCIPILSGTYTICEVLQEGWLPTTEICQTVVINPCQAIKVIFGNRKCDTREGVICGMKFNDLNGNGVKDPGEPGLPGWKIIVDGVTMAVTDDGGFYCITLPAGGHVVEEGQQPGWKQTFPDFGKYAILLDACTVVSPVDFGNFFVGEALPRTTPGPGESSSDLFDPHLTSMPNPTSGETFVQYELTQDANITLELFDALGRHVKSIEQVHQSQGSHGKRVDLSGMPAGVYRLRLSVDKAFYTIQVVVQ